jgi:hypothetical protein
LIEILLEESGQPIHKHDPILPLIEKRAFALKLPEFEERKNYHFMYFYLYQGKNLRDGIVETMLRNLKNNFEFSKSLAKNIDFTSYKNGMIL